MSERVITLSHGSGGEAMRRLIGDLFARHFANPLLEPLSDAALFESDSGRLAFTTDSYVVKPLEFPGGDIGKLAVCGTVNDLAVVGTQPRYLSAGFIIEEGFALSRLERIVRSMADAAIAAGVQIVTGDTKVVPHSECDGLFINTSGVGTYPLGSGLSSEPPCAGDGILVSGTLGEHGVAVLEAREGFAFKTHVESDCAALNGLIGHVLENCTGVKWMRDPTRGGLAAALAELVENKPFGALLCEGEIPVRDDVRAVCELLGFDPLHLANEGKVALVVKECEVARALALLREHELGRNAAVIGRITSEQFLRMETAAGGVRRLQRPAGELLPRIC